MAKHDQRKGAEPIVTTLGRETEFSGRLSFTESLKIEGKFDGEIDSSGFLFIDEGAEVKASLVKAASVIVGGVVRGNIEAADKVEMLPSAKVYGNVRTSKLRIADGVIFEGRCEMIRSPLQFNPFTAQGPQAT
jgi:cytoskeletal protein CcmA (bactofilin family)